MGIIYTCDGCGKHSSKWFERYSFNRGREGEILACQWNAELCDSCAKQVDAPRTWPRAAEPS